MPPRRVLARLPQRTAGRRQGAALAPPPLLTKYLRFDRVAPQPAVPTTLILLSIPDKFRIRPARFRDAKAFVAEKYAEFQADTGHRHVPVFLEYNLALAPVPRRMKKYQSRYATCFLVLRDTPANSCFRRKDMSGLPPEVWDHTMLSPASLLGFAVLDAEYALLPGEPPARADGVPSVPAARHRSRRRWRGYVWSYVGRAQDVRPCHAAPGPRRRTPPGSPGSSSGAPTAIPSSSSCRTSACPCSSRPELLREPRGGIRPWIGHARGRGHRLRVREWLVPR